MVRVTIEGIERVGRVGKDRGGIVVAVGSSRSKMSTTCHENEDNMRNGSLYFCHGERTHYEGMVASAHFIKIRCRFICILVRGNIRAESRLSFFGSLEEAE